VPANVDGEWRFELSSGVKSRRTRLVLKQKYQVVSGTVELTGQGDVRLSGGRLRGDELRLTLPAGAVDRGPVEMVGRVNGGKIVGTLRKAGRDLANWNAQRKS
jgi:hypothetical protein